MGVVVEEVIEIDGGVFVGSCCHPPPPKRRKRERESRGGTNYERKRQLGFQNHGLAISCNIYVPLVL